MSYAAPDRPIVGNEDVRQALARQKEQGKQPDVRKVLAEHLAAGRGLSAGVVKKYNAGKYPIGRYGGIPIEMPVEMAAGYGLDGKLEKRYGRGSIANLAGLKGAELGKGDVYMGATAINTQRTSTWTPNGGEASTPASTRYDITVLPRWMVRPQPQDSSASTPVDKPPAATTAVLPDLAKAREAFDRAGAYKSQSGGLDLSPSGPALYQNIHDAGTSGIGDYEQRFIPELMANANLTAQEIRYGASSALDSLPDDLKLPTYDKVFPSEATDKQGLYRWLERRIK